MSDNPPPRDAKPSLFERLGAQPSSALAARLAGAPSDAAASSTSTGFPAQSSSAAPVFAVPVSKKPKTGDSITAPPPPSSVAKCLSLSDLLERARAATERRQLDLADHYFSIASARFGSRFTKESVLDHASVLLLLGESVRAAALAASLADPLQISSSIYERAVYVQGAALLAAEDYAGCKAVLERGLASFPHSQQMKETLTEAVNELAAASAGVSANDAMTISLLADPVIVMKPSFTLQYATTSSRIAFM